MKYKVIGFDYSGVITESSGESFTLGVCSVLNITRNEFNDVYFKNNYLINTTNIEPREFWVKLLKEWNKEDKEKDFFDFLESSKSSDRKYNYALIDFIKELKNLGYKIGLISNNSSRLHDTLKGIGIHELFDVVLVSGEVGYMKPDREIFQMLCSHFGVEGEEMIFVDDFSGNFVNAQEVGFTPVLYKDFNSLKDQFKELGII